MDESPQRPRGAQLLDAWCDERRGRAAQLATVLGVEESTVSRWRRGTAAPGGPARTLIARATAAAVPLDAWAQPAPETAETLDVAPSPTLPAVTP